MKSGVPKAPQETIEYRSYCKHDKSSFIKDLKETDWNMVDFNGDVDPGRSCCGNVEHPVY